MIMRIEEADTKGGIIIPKGRFKEFVGFQRRWAEGKSEIGKVHSKGFIYEPSSAIPNFLSANGHFWGIESEKDGKEV